MAPKAKTMTASTSNPSTSIKTSHSKNITATEFVTMTIGPATTATIGNATDATIGIATSTATTTGTATATTMATTIGTTITSKTRRSQLPDYFEELDDLEKARACFIKRDPNFPNNVTHMTSTLFSEVDPTNEDHFIEIKSFTLDQLRKICTQFSKPRPVKLADAMINIHDIMNE